MSAFRVIGTAGHIDHGKTSLVKALTGIDTDRLKEEKQRGITIELGFAHLRLPSGATVSVVDVPGHERFIRTMVAGAVGIDAVVLVVAADEGVMPQTREHLDICELLGVQSGVVALTKCDLVTDDLLALAKQELRQVLAGTFLAHADIVPCSAHSGVGLSDLSQAIERTLHRLPGRDTESAVRLPVDRVFTLKGFGTVVTGTQWSGTLKLGDELVALPSAKTVAKVRGLHVHGKAVSESQAGQRTAVNLSVPLTAIAKGETLVPPGVLVASSVLDVKLRYLPVARLALPRRSRLLVHVGTAQRLCNVTLLDRETLEPGQTAYAQILLSEPLCAMPGDHFVLRGFAPQKHHGTTVGGGLVLRNLAHPQRRKNWHGSDTLTAYRNALQALADESLRAAAIESLVSLHTERRGLHGTSLLDLQRSLPLGLPSIKQALSALLQRQVLRKMDDIPEQEAGAWLSSKSLQTIEEGILSTVKNAIRNSPGSSGLAKEALRSRLFGPLQGITPRLLDAVCQQLVRDGKMFQQREELSTTRDDAKPQDSLPVQAILHAIQKAGLAGPKIEELIVVLPPDVAKQTSKSPPLRPEEIKRLLEPVIRRGDVIRLKDLLFHRSAIDDLRDRLVAFLRQHREISPTQFKDLVGQSRKYSIPLAEYFDAQRLTLRVGDQRRLRQAPPI